MITFRKYQYVQLRPITGLHLPHIKFLQSWINKWWHILKTLVFTDSSAQSYWSAGSSFSKTQYSPNAAFQPIMADSEM